MLFLILTHSAYLSELTKASISSISFLTAILQASSTGKESLQTTRTLKEKMTSVQACPMPLLLVLT